MKITTKQQTEKDGRLRLEWRFSCERSAPRGENPRHDVEADIAEEQATDIVNSALNDGLPYIVATREYVGPNRYASRNDMDLLLRDDDGEGWPGNSDPHIHRYHGWRGTMNDWAIYAHGLRRVLDVRLTGKRSKRVVVILGRDLAEDRD